MKQILKEVYNDSKIKFDNSNYKKSVEYPGNYNHTNQMQLKRI